MIAGRKQASAVYFNEAVFIPLTFDIQSVAVNGA